METGTKRSPLQELRVVEVMHPGVIACPHETPLRTVARMMAADSALALADHEHRAGRLMADPLADAAEGAHTVDPATSDE